MNTKLNLCFYVKQSGENKIYHTSTNEEGKDILIENFKMIFEPLTDIKAVGKLFANGLNFLFEQKQKDNLGQFNKPIIGIKLLELNDKEELIKSVAVLNNLKPHILLNCRGLGIDEKNRFLTFKENLISLIIDAIGNEDNNLTKHKAFLNSVAIKHIIGVTKENVKEVKIEETFTAFKKDSKNLSTERKEYLKDFEKRCSTYCYTELRQISSQIKRLETRLQSGKLSAEDSKKTTLKINSLTKARDEKRLQVSNVSKQLAY